MGLITEAIKNLTPQERAAIAAAEMETSRAVYDSGNKAVAGFYAALAFLLVTGVISD